MNILSQIYELLARIQSVNGKIIPMVTMIYIQNVMIMNYNYKGNQEVDCSGFNHLTPTSSILICF